MRHFAAGFCIAVAALLCIPQGFAMRTMDFFEQYDLSELRYVGLRKQACDASFRQWATVLDPWGFPHPVHRDNYMGYNFGKVTQINATHLVVEELLQDAQGEWFARPVILPLVENRSLPARSGFEKNRVLDLLGRNDEGRQLKKQLVWCQALYGKDAERLACFDRAVGTLF